MSAAEAPRTRLEPATYRWDGSYVPSEVAAYLAVGLPEHLQMQRSPTSRRIYRWIRSGLVAPEKRLTPASELTINFEDLVTCHAVTLLQEAGLTQAQIKDAEQRFSRRYGVAKPFAHRDYWSSGSSHLTAFAEGVVEPGSKAGQPGWQGFLAQGIKLLGEKLGFSDQTGQAAQWEPKERIVLRPDIQFGRPCIKGTRITTSTLWSYVTAGEPPQAVAEDYEVEVTDVERAVAWEQQVRAVLHAATPVSPR